MRKTIMALMVAGLLPGAAFANGYENADYVGAYIIDENGTTPIGIDGRMAISGEGKVVGDLIITSETAFTALSLSGGYRHTLYGLDFAGQSLISVGGGVNYSSVTDKNTDNTVSETDFYVESDIERPVGRTGVVHGVVGYTNSDVYLGGGYTHYFTPQFGARGEIILDGPIKIGGTYRF